MRALITGVTGFVGKYLADHLLNNDIEVWGTTRLDSPFLHLKNGNVGLIQSELNNTEDIYQILVKIKPDYIFHLAGQSNVKRSWDNPEETFYANVNKTIFLLDACVKYQMINPDFRILTIGSSEEYGKVESHELPITEETPLRPSSPYGISKAAVSGLIQQYHKAFRLNVIHARPFNHIGPGQSLGFVTSDFAKQIVDIEIGNQEPIINVGNLASKRDFTDVRDVVSAYLLAVEKGICGEIYNICSGKVISINKLLNTLVSSSNKMIKVNSDVTKYRPIDTPEYYGSNYKFVNLTSWKCKYTINQTLDDILEMFRNMDWKVTL